MLLTSRQVRYPSLYLTTTMAIQRESIESEKVSESPVDEKHVVDSEVASVNDSIQEDEALQLVGKERTQEFSEEYNRRLRRKLVSETLHGLFPIT